MEISKRKNKAFTLSEVLITLAIIGIVASIVLPTLMNQTNDAELKTLWRKDYQTLDQAARLLMLNNGGTIAGYCQGDPASHCIRDLYIPYLKVSTVCDQATNEGCWHKTGSWLAYDGSSGFGITSGFPDLEYPGLVLFDGTLIVFQWLGSDCPGYDACGHITVDVNGFKGPNTIGKDIFVAWITGNGILPNGAPYTGNYGNGYEYSSIYLRQ